MNWLCIPGWATEPSIFDAVLPDGMNRSLIDLNFFNDSEFPKIERGEYDGVICYSLGSLIALQIHEIRPFKKMVFIGGFTLFTGLDKRRTLKINLMIRGLKKNPEKTLKDFYNEAGLKVDLPEHLNVNNLIYGLELLRDCDMSHAINEKNTVIYTIHGKEDLIVPYSLNNEQFNGKVTNSYTLAGNHGNIQSHSEEIKKVLSGIL